MVKTPRTRHSKSTRQPVTIDLSPEEVSRAEAQAGMRDEAQAGTQDDAAPVPPAAEETPVPEPEAATSGQETPADDPVEEPVAAEQPSPAEEPFVAESAPQSEPEQASSGAEPEPVAGPTFGRREAPPAAPPPEPRRGGNGGLLGAGVAGGVVALLLLGGLHFAGVLPATDGSPQEQGPALAALESEVADLRGQVSALEAAGGDDPALAGRLAQAEENLAQLSAALEALRTQVAALGDDAGGEAPAPVDLAPLEERVAAVETAVSDLAGSVPEQADLSGIEEAVAALREEIATAREGQAAASARLDSLEQALAGLGERLDEQAEAPATALIIAASALRAAVDRGAPFVTELDTFAALAPEAPQIEGLRAHAENGVATRADLAAGSNAAANAMIAAAQPVDADAGIVDRLWASAMGLVQVRPIGMVEGDGVPEIVARIDAAVAAGDYERALAEFDTLPEEAKAAGEPFIARLRARHEAERLVDEALAGALRA